MKHDYFLVRDFHAKMSEPAGPTTQCYLMHRIHPPSIFIYAIFMGVDLINPLEGLEKTIGNVVLVINLLRNRIILFFKNIFYKEFFLRI